MGLSLRVHYHFDKEANSYWTTSPDLRGLVVAADTLEELRKEVSYAALDLIDLAVSNDHDKVTSIKLCLHENIKFKNNTKK